MSAPDDPEDGTPRARADSLKRQVQALAGNQMKASESEELPDETREAFWRQVLECETASLTTNLQQLINRGVEVPSPETLNDDALTAKLWEVIHALAELRVFLYRTDHLSDRELYTELWGRVLRDEVEDVEADANSCTIVDLVSSGSAEHVKAWLTYYADENARRRWKNDFPEDPLPARRKRPYRRDRRLPRAEWLG